VALGLLARASRLLEIRAQLRARSCCSCTACSVRAISAADGVVRLLHRAERLVQPGMLFARLSDVGGPRACARR